MKLPETRTAQTQRRGISPRCGISPVRPAPIWCDAAYLILRPAETAPNSVGADKRDAKPCPFLLQFKALLLPTHVSAHSSRILAAAPAFGRRVPLRRRPRRPGGAHARPRLAALAAGRDRRAVARAGARRGYRLVAAPDFLDASAVRAALVEYGVTLAANGLSPLRPRTSTTTSGCPARRRYPRSCRGRRSTWRSSTRSTRPPRNCCAAHRAATSTARRSPPSGRPLDVAAVDGRGTPSPAAAHLFARLAFRAGRGIPRRPVACRRRRRHPRAREGRHPGRRPEVAERPDPPSPEGRRDSRRVERRRARSVDGGRRRGPQCRMRAS